MSYVPFIVISFVCFQFFFFPTSVFRVCTPSIPLLSGSGSLDPTTSVLRVCTPSVLRFSDHRALRHTTSPFSRTLLPVPPFSVLVYFSFLECLTSYRSFVVLCLGFEPGRHSSVGNTLTTKRLCSVVVW